MASVSETEAAPRPRQIAGLSLERWRAIGIAAFLAAACVLPFFLSNYHNLQLATVVIYAIALMGLNLLTGFNGQISLGHGAFYAIGAYTTAILTAKFGVPYWATVPVAGVICLVVGFLIGLPALRLEGLYLALATFALALATPQLLKFKPLDPWTGGVQGVLLRRSASNPPWGLPLTRDQWLYFLCLAIAIPMFWAARNLIRGRTGRAIVAIRDHPVAAETMGVNIAIYKSAAFGVSALYTGVAGALGAVVVGFVAPESFPLFLSLSLLVGIVVGGLASISGAIFGAIFIEFVPNLSDELARSIPSIANWLLGYTPSVAEQAATAAQWTIYGLVLIAFMYAMPTGVAGFIRLLWGRLARGSGDSG
ncbi:MAG TPA: branched-chain amino acid ABC transporter permease [Stellaceae bacterium]|nr:branched-chain amino acid ABC transporter permease [Stellaceae bacterium]